MLIEFCLPAYNEEKIIKENTLKLLNYLEMQNFNFIWHIVVIINGSSDKSLEIIDGLEKKYTEKIKIENIPESGKGKAIKHWVKKSQSDLIAYMDIDLAVSLENIPDLINPIIDNKTDIVIGSRHLPDSKIKRSFIRELSSRGYILMSRIILGHKFSDLQCGFKAIRTDAFKKIIPCIKDEKWFFDTELIVWAKFFNCRVKEIPVDWSENRYDLRKSKVKLFRDSLKFIRNLIALKIRLVKAKNK